MSEKSNPSSDPDINPSLELAYEFILPTYELVVRRLESAERRIDNMMTFIITLTTALGAAGIAIVGLSDKTPSVFLDSAAYIAITFFAINLVSGIYLRQMGGVEIFDLRYLLSEEIGRPADKFKATALRTAGMNIANVQSLINRKSGGTTFMLVPLLIEVSAAALWIHDLVSYQVPHP